MTDNIHFSSQSNEWQTPIDLFQKLDQEFNFDFDTAASDTNHLCKKFFTMENSALDKNWADYGKVFWCNCPYGREIGKFVKKSYEQSLLGVTVVLLIPARVDTKWFYNYCSKGEVRFLKGRIKFVNPTFPSFREDGDFKLSPAPFPSAVVVFTPDMKPVTKYWDWKA
jgi:phage N-6-adenine-methyltransferase